VAESVLAAEVTAALRAGARTRGAVDEVAARHGVPRRRVYELALRLREAAGAGQDEE
jgi:hypothetical protein